MLPSLSAVFHWLQANEAIAMWVEGIALVLIFGLELAEYKRQGQERKDQHKESVEQMAIMQSQADAAKANAEAARLNAQAVLNSERAWIEISLEPPPHLRTSFMSFSRVRFKSRITAGHLHVIETVQIGMDTVDGPVPERPSNSMTTNLHSLLGSGQTEKVGVFNAESAFSDGASVVNGTHKRDSANHCEVPRRGGCFHPSRNVRILCVSKQLGRRA